MFICWRSRFFRGGIKYSLRLFNRGIVVYKGYRYNLERLIICVNRLRYCTWVWFGIKWYYLIKLFVITSHLFSLYHIGVPPKLNISVEVSVLLLLSHINAVLNICNTLLETSDLRCRECAKQICQFLKHKVELLVILAKLIFTRYDQVALGT